MDPNKKNSFYPKKIDLHIRGPPTCESADASANKPGRRRFKIILGWASKMDSVHRDYHNRNMLQVTNKFVPAGGTGQYGGGWGGGGTRENMYYVARAVFLVMILTIWIT